MSTSTTEAPKLRASTMAEALVRTSAGHEGVAARFKREGEWVDVSHHRLREVASEIARGLIALGIDAGDRVAILSNTRPEWTYADLGAICAGAVVTPVYQTNSPRECHYVLEHSGSRLVFCEGGEQLRKIEQVRGELPELEHVVAFEDAGTAGSISLDELRERGREVDDGRLDERIAGGAPTTCSRPSTPPAPPATPRAAC